MKQKLFALAIFSALSMGTSTATLAAMSYTSFGAIAAGGNPGHAAQLVSDETNAKPWGGIHLAATTVTTLNSMTFLGTDYKLVAGDCGGGSPRFEIGLPGGKVINVYIGPAPSFAGCATGWQTTGNLLTSADLRVDTSNIAGGTFYDTWEHALALAGSSAVSSIDIVVDSSWSKQAAPAGVQTVLVDNVKVNGDTVAFEPDTTMIIPLVAQTTSYTSQITVRNPYDDMALPISVSYTGAIGSWGVGARACTPLSVPPLGTMQFSAAEQCALPSGNQFGYVTLTVSDGLPSPFIAFSRTQTPGGNGFSVPAYPASAIEAPGRGQYAVALKRQAAAPTYQSNCFVASTDYATPYQIRLLNAQGQQIGNTISGTLTAHQMVRYLDIFAAAELPPGDFSNVSADFSNGGSNAPLMGFCTVQESTFFGADFRLAEPPKTWRYDPE